MVVDQLITSQTTMERKLGKQMIYISRKINKSGDVRGAKQIL